MVYQGPVPLRFSETSNSCTQPRMHCGDTNKWHTHDANVQSHIFTLAAARHVLGYRLQGTSTGP